MCQEPWWYISRTFLSVKRDRNFEKSSEKSGNFFNSANPGGISSYLSQRQQGGAHATDEFVEPLQLLQQYDGRRWYIEAESLAYLLQIHLLREFTDDVADDFVQIVFTADPRPSVTWNWG